MKYEIDTIKITSLLLKGGVTQSYLAEKIGITKSAISHLLNGTSAKKHNRRTVVRISEALDVPLSDILL